MYENVIAVHLQSACGANAPNITSHPTSLQIFASCTFSTRNSFSLGFLWPLSPTQLPFTHPYQQNFLSVKGIDELANIWTSKLSWGMAICLPIFDNGVSFQLHSKYLPCHSKMWHQCLNTTHNSLEMHHCIPTPRLNWTAASIFGSTLDEQDQHVALSASSSTLAHYCKVFTKQSKSYTSLFILPTYNEKSQFSWKWRNATTSQILYHWAMMWVMQLQQKLP